MLHRTTTPSLVFLVICACGLTRQRTSDTADSACEGLAGRYPGDVGLFADPAVIFSEDFEGSLPDLLARFDEVGNPHGMSQVEDVGLGTGGSRALEIRAVGGQDTGGHLYLRLADTPDTLHLRYRVRYAEGDSYHHTGGWLGGYHPPTPWPQGGAGTRPRGDDRFSIGVEPTGESLRADVYVYWSEMRSNPGGTYFGNSFVNDEDVRFADRGWTTVEVMVQLNDPARRNGKLALWLDGHRVLDLGEGVPHGEWIWDAFHRGPGGEPFEGFRWRTTSELDLNWLWMLHYATDLAPRAESRVAFDDLVVATEYVGPVCL